MADPSPADAYAAGRDAEAAGDPEVAIRAYAAVVAAGGHADARERLRALLSGEGPQRPVGPVAAPAADPTADRGFVIFLLFAGLILAEGGAWGLRALVGAIGGDGWLAGFAWLCVCAGVGWIFAIGAADSRSWPGVAVSLAPSAYAAAWWAMG